jgi:hypothetical protein
MPSSAVYAARDLTPELRRRQVAAILAQGVIRHRRIAELAKFGELPGTRDTGLEVVSETRLTVSQGLANKTQDPDCEVNDGKIER